MFRMKEVLNFKIIISSKKLKIWFKKIVLKFKSFLRLKKKDFLKYWNLFRYEVYRKINFSRWDVKYRLEGIKNGVWK